jgi:shikimate dehydrogenase
VGDLAKGAGARPPGALVPRLGVLGWPVAHSRSPAMHNAALAELGLTEWRYQLLPAPPELFAEIVRALPGAGFVGANVTIPHKHAALALADSASAAAQVIGAANTLSFDPKEGIVAENTDAPGLIAAMERAGCSPRGRSAMVLGAGGSARAVVWALREAGAGEVSIYNRTRARAVELSASLGARVVPLPEKADILINCTSVGLVRPSGGGDDDLNQLGLSFDLVGRYSYVVDLVYTEGDTQLLAAACEQGVPTLDGLEILVAQGALSLELWTGRSIDDRMRSSDRPKLGDAGLQPGSPCRPAPLDVMRTAAREPAGDLRPDEDEFPSERWGN